MTNDEFHNLWLPARNVIINHERPWPDTNEHSEDFEKYLGTTEYTQWRNSPVAQHDPPMNDSLRRVLEAVLHSPHWPTIVRVYRIQKGLVGNDSR